MVGTSNGHWLLNVVTHDSPTRHPDEWGTDGGMRTAPRLHRLDAIALKRAVAYAKGAQAKCWMVGERLVETWWNM